MTFVQYIVDHLPFIMLVTVCFLLALSFGGKFR